jgi:SP family sugar:H+ symporter-like MFS transporter
VIETVVLFHESDDLQKLTPIMLADISYGTFLLFGAACIIMGVYTIFFVPETKGVPLESIHVLFEGNIVKGCVQDLFPGTSRAKRLMAQVRTDDGASEDGDDVRKKGGRVEQVERV